MVLAVLARILLAGIIVWAFVSGRPEAWSLWLWRAVLGVPGLFFLGVVIREQVRLSRFASRVDERHPDMLRRYRVRTSWLTADLGSLAAMARDDAIVSDPALMAEAGGVRLLSKIQWGLYWVLLVAVVAGVVVLQLWPA